jgi:hypothetical protein
MYGTSLPLNASGGASAFQQTILVNDFDDVRQSVTTSGLTATPALRDDVGR